MKISYQQYEDYIEQLIEKARQHKQIANGVRDIIAIARGGLYPAQRLAYAFGIYRVHTIGIHSYLGKKKQSVVEVYQPLQLNLAHRVPKCVFIVDNLLDTGDTMETVIEEVKKSGLKCEVYTAALFLKTDSAFTPNIYCEKVDAKTWITFPYE